jgi:eukaryotic-like serine/threonine-protein kinase
VRVCPVCARSFAAEESSCPEHGVSLVSLDSKAQGRLEDLTGTVIDGRYRVEQIIGRGGMGSVYAGRHIVVGKRVALKVLRPGLERSEDVLSRFVREAQAANSVKSPHIAEVFDFGQLPSGHFYAAMELLEGKSLAEAMRARLLTRDQLLYVFTQLAETLAETHEAGVIHRDLKPENVFLTRDPGSTNAALMYVKILDFGVAKLVGAADGGLTQSGVILGTPYYMAPEQARGEAIDHRVDIYSLGVVMFHAFTGRLPFMADSAVGVLTKHAIDPPPRPSSVSQVDPGVEQLILRCLEKQPGSRFASMRDIADELRALRRDPSLSASPGVPHPEPKADTYMGASVTGGHRASVATPESSKPKWPYIVAGVGMLALGASLAVLMFARAPTHVVAQSERAAPDSPSATAAATTDASQREDLATSPSASSSAPAVAEPNVSASSNPIAPPSVAVPIRTGAVGPRPSAAVTTPPKPSGAPQTGEIRNPFLND